MKVKKIIHNGWKLLREYGDIEKIIEASKTDEKPYGLTRPTISHALRTGVMSETTFEIINKFYNERSDKMSKAVQVAQRQKELIDNDKN